MNHYARAIEILMSGECDWRLIAQDYAKRHPAKFIDAHQVAQRSSGMYGWKKEAFNLRQAGQKIDAIKHCRAITGMGLKEAKEAVESL